MAVINAKLRQLEKFKEEHGRLPNGDDHEDEAINYYVVARDVRTEAHKTKLQEITGKHWNKTFVADVLRVISVTSNPRLTRRLEQKKAGIKAAETRGQNKDEVAYLDENNPGWRNLSGLTNKDGEPINDNIYFELGDNWETIDSLNKGGGEQPRKERMVKRVDRDVNAKCRNALFAQRGMACQHCRNSTHDRFGRPLLEAAHIIAVEDGGTDKFDNLLALCPTCHAQFDRRDAKGEYCERKEMFITIERSKNRRPWYFYKGRYGDRPPGWNGRKLIPGRSESGQESYSAKEHRHEARQSRPPYRSERAKETGGSFRTSRYKNKGRETRTLSELPEIYHEALHATK